jgi:hypothetical protein
MTEYPVSKTNFDLRTFIRELETRLNVLSHEDLKSLLIQRARGLTMRERSEFLSMFPPVTKAGLPAVEPSACDDELISDIKAFVQALEDGEYFEYSCWDESIEDERAFGDDTWVVEMDILFDRASRMYLTGHRDLAGEAYGKLLHAFELSHEEGHFCGEDAPESLVKTDVTEVKARYLRCIYETTPQGSRAPRILDELEDLHYIGEEIGLADIINSDAEPLPGMDEFLTEWIAELKSVDSRSTSENAFRWWRPLLREAVVLHNGVDGLAELARESGDVHPEAYQDWAMLLWQSEDIPSAISAAREGVERILDRKENARLADALATMASRSGDSDLAVATRKQAWRTDPSLRRLLLYADEGSPDRRTLDERLHQELVGELEERYRIPTPSFDPNRIPRLRFILHLIAHDYSFATQYVDAIEPLGWTGTETPIPIIFPFLTLAASGMTTRPAEGSSLAQLVSEMAGACGTQENKPHLLPDTMNEPAASMLGRLLLDTLIHHPVTAEDRRRYLEMAKTITKERIHTIVSNTRRGEYEYEQAARLAVAIGESISVQGAASTGMNYVISFRDTYPHHRAFRAELDELIDRSPYLPSSPRKKGR